MAFSFITGASQQKRKPGFLTEWVVSGDATARTITLPITYASSVNCRVNWGDGSPDTYLIDKNSPERIHTYAIDGTYIIEISGMCDGFGYGWTATNPEPERLKLRKVLDWGHYSRFEGFTQVYFFRCTNLNYVAPNLDTSKFTTLVCAFQYCTGLTSLDVSGWDVSKVTIFGQATGTLGAFYGCTGLTSLDCSTWTFSTVSNINFLNVFGGCTNLETIKGTSNWNTEKFISLSGAFSSCNKLKSINDDPDGLDVSNWNVTNVTNMSNLFNSCISLTQLDVSSWNVTKCTDFGYTFYNLRITSLDCSSWVFNNTGFSLFATFYLCSSLQIIYGTGSWNVGKCTNFNATFANCTVLKSVDADPDGLDVSLWDMSSATTLATMFFSDYALTSLDVSNWNTSNVTNLVGTFQKCTGLTSLDISGWNVSKVTLWGQSSGDYGTFAGCTGLTSLDCSTWTFSTVSNINFLNVFGGCINLETIKGTSNWNTEKFISMRNTFYNCQSLVSIDTNVDGLDVSGWNISNCVDLNSTFQDCRSLTQLDCSSWSFSTTTLVGISALFYSCVSLETIKGTSNWNTEKIANMSQCFMYCYSLLTIDTSIDGLDVRRWNVSSCTIFNYMFAYSTSLTQLDIALWQITGQPSTIDMFRGCSGLISIVIPTTMSKIHSKMAVELSAITNYYSYPTVAPAIDSTYGSPFENYAKPLHVPVSNSGYNVAPWTTVAIFSSIIADIEILTIDVSPATDWATGDTITGQTSTQTCVILNKITATTYYVGSRSGAFTLGEIIGVTGNADKLADQGASYPIFT